ncbi:MAG: DUF2892 domain-containing protein [Bacteriovoracaceae bacterium]|nr:DUF2892 domain-containing protein [Bacteriovoracaceae bacterium]
MNECTAKDKWVDKMLRGIAGGVILVAVLLFFLHSTLWIWFIGFVGLNLLQSAFTNWCPMMTILRKLKS